MAQDIMLLDCTLRDGAYIVDAKFGTAAMRGIIKHMQDAGAEIVECGWLKNAAHEVGTSFFHVPSDLEQYLAERKEGVVYSAMIDWDRYDLSYLPPCDGKSINAIRVVFPHGKYKEGIEVGKGVREKGYRLFFQAANTLAYSDEDLDELAAAMNEVKPESLSVVDTFGAMFEDDLARIVRRLDERLDKGIKLGFHSHNNQQLSFALSMQFVHMLKDSGRNIVVDSSLCGMGRGAGNATTELMASFLNRKCGKKYDLNMILDAIDVFMEYFIKNFSWGYSTPYFISGMYCTHVNNIAYLIDKHRTRAKDMNGIIESLPPAMRLKYDYDLLEQKYLEHFQKGVDDGAAMEALREKVKDRPVLMLCSGRSVLKEKDKVEKVIKEQNPIVIGVNAMFPGYRYDMCFFSNQTRYEYMMMDDLAPFGNVTRIVTSNVKTSPKGQEVILDFNRLIKRGWKYFDNAGIICLRLLAALGVQEILLAGFDGFGLRFDENYADPRMPSVNADNDWDVVNENIAEMLQDFRATDGKDVKVRFVTKSLFDSGVAGK